MSNDVVEKITPAPIAAPVLLRRVDVRVTSVFQHGSGSKLDQ
jgi:hypothetical protein